MGMHYKETTQQQHLKHITYKCGMLAQTQKRTFAVAAVMYINRFHSQWTNRAGNKFMLEHLPYAKNKQQAVRNA